MTSPIFECLPGIPLPFGDVTPTLVRMWDIQNHNGMKDSQEYRSSQMNVILHFGWKTTSEEARAHFDVMLEFSKRYPCRVIILCPNDTLDKEMKLEGKLFTQCYIGKGQRSKCCCEIVLLNYSRDESALLEDQVSTLLETDLPTYYWFHRVPAAYITEYYLTALKNLWGIVYDSSVELFEYADIPWPHPQNVHNLVHFKVIPIQKALGQFLSAFSPKQLTNGLKEVKVFYAPRLHTEGEYMLIWQKKCLSDCLDSINDSSHYIKYCGIRLPEISPIYIKIEWIFEGNQSFQWELIQGVMVAQLEANFSGEKISHPQHLNFPEPEAVLASAFFK